MSKWRLIGLSSVKVGAVNTTTFAMPSTFTTILNVIPGTAKIAIPVPTKTRYFTEDTDYADMSVSEAGKTTVEFATRDMLGAFFKLGMGGTVSGTTVWKAPTTALGVVEKSLQLTSKVYQGKKFVISIPRALFGASAALNFSNKGATEPGSIAYQATVLLPTSSVAVSPMKMLLST